MYSTLANPNAFHFNVGKGPTPKIESLMVDFYALLTDLVRTHFSYSLYPWYLIGGLLISSWAD